MIPDAEVIKTCLAIIRNPNRHNKVFHIVAELREAKNLSVAKIVGGNEVEWVLSENIIAKMIAQTCFQPGLSTIYTDLMDFSGDEVYFYNHPSLIKTFVETLNYLRKMLLLKYETINLHSLIRQWKQYLRRQNLFTAEVMTKYTLVSKKRSYQCNSIRNFNSVRETEKFLIVGWNYEQSIIGDGPLHSSGSKFK